MRRVGVDGPVVRAVDFQPVPEDLEVAFQAQTKVATVRPERHVHMVVAYHRPFGAQVVPVDVVGVIVQRLVVTDVLVQTVR